MASDRAGTQEKYCCCSAAVQFAPFAIVVAQLYSRNPLLDFSLWTNRAILWPRSVLDSYSAVVILRQATWSQ